MTNPLTLELIKEIDKLTPDPSQRAELVWNYLQQHPALTTWDVFCFAVEYIAGRSIEWSFINPEAVHTLIQNCYIAHYVKHNPANNGVLENADSKISNDSKTRDIPSIVSQNRESTKSD